MTNVPLDPNFNQDEKIFVPLDPNLTEISKNKKKPLCQICHKQKVHYYCPVEKLNLCKNCNNQIHPNEFLINFHKVTLYTEEENSKKIELCGRHQKELSLYCLNHQEIICTKCMDDYCVDHNKDIIRLGKAAKDLYDQCQIIRHEIEKLHFQIKNEKSATEISMKKINQKYDNFKLYMSKRKTQLISQIENTYKESLSCIEKCQLVTNKQLQNSLNSQQEIYNEISKYKKTCNKLSRYRKNKNLIQTITYSLKIIQKQEGLEHFTNSNIDFHKNRNVELDIIPEQIYLGDTLDVNVKIGILQENEIDQFQTDGVILNLQLPSEKQLQGIHLHPKKDQSIEEVTSINKEKKNVKKTNKNENDLIKREKNEYVEYYLKLKPSIIGNYNIHSIKLSNKEQRKLTNKVFQVLTKEKKDRFDPEYKSVTTELSNENRTVRQNPVNFLLKSRSGDMGTICGERVYSKGVHHFEFKIDCFHTERTDLNWIEIGVIDAERKEIFVRLHKSQGSFYYKTTHKESNKNGMISGTFESRSFGEIDGKRQNEQYGIPFITGNILGMKLDMDKHQLSFSVNGKGFGVASTHLPKTVCIFVNLYLLSRWSKKNQITLL
ncbi:spry domain containing socs box protein [Anaeramoeba flamelloides]|uniref:Spry domain containing socs box protein n=1 Tax=Anaeramoeba flamelloides TaxID=1746091 RepID=A0ABQ8ZBU6_9EUKA|nr:spry domain containing socs box protein [Anaeramoeba flamelloides]